MNLQLTLAWRYLKGRKLRTFLTTLAVIFGVMLIFGMNIILPTMLEAFQANLMAAGNLVDVTVTNKSGGGFPLDVANKLDGISGIRASSGLLERTVNLPANFVDGNPDKTDEITAVTLIGVDPGSCPIPARLPRPGAGDDSCRPVTRMPPSFHRPWRMPLESSLGGMIRLPSINGTQSLTVVGILPPRTVPGNEEVLVTLPQAQAMTGQARPDLRPLK